MKTWQFVLILIFLAAVDFHLLLIIKPDLKEVPNTEDWFCLVWMGLVTEAGLGLIWYQLSHKQNNKNDN